VGETAGGTVALVVREGRRDGLSVRRLPLDAIAEAVVQVEFSPPNPRELELAAQTGKEVGR
jgi:ribosome maturation factor RimP